MWLVNHFMHNVEQWLNMLKNSCGVNTARFLSMFVHFSTYMKWLTIWKQPIKFLKRIIDAKYFSGILNINVLGILSSVK